MSGNGQRIGVLGATGFIGRVLTDSLEQAGSTVIRFSRNPPEGEPGWRRMEAILDLGGLDAVVNLAGESVARRWSKAVWRRIVDSRVGLTRSVVESLARMDPAERPKVLVSASATGFYGSRGDDDLSEAEGPGSDALAVLCRDWEAEAVKAEAYGVRVVLPRIGIVLGKGGGALQSMLRPFKLGLGGRLGSGRQWMPWVSLDDVVAALIFALRTESLEGPVNLAAPGAVTNRGFTRALSSALRRPAFFPAPAFLLRLALGRGFGDVLLGSSRVVPERLLDAGFQFRDPDLEATLEELICS